MGFLGSVEAIRQLRSEKDAQIEALERLEAIVGSVAVGTKGGRGVVSLAAGVFTAAGAGVKTNLLFFTKGQPTRRIWYYDMTDVKVRKKAPLTLKHFEDFLRVLPERTDGELSWTVDMEPRTEPAATTPTGTYNQTKSRDDPAIEEAEARAKELAREARDLAAKAKEIEDAVYDLKAVNPHKRPVVDTRTPEELMDVIWTKGQEVAEALAALRSAVGAEP